VRAWLPGQSGAIADRKTREGFKPSHLAECPQPLTGGRRQRDCHSVALSEKRFNEPAAEGLDSAGPGGDDGYRRHSIARQRSAKARSAVPRPAVLGDRRCKVLTVSRTAALCRTTYGADRSASSS